MEGLLRDENIVSITLECLLTYL